MTMDTPENQDQQQEQQPDAPARLIPPTTEKLENYNLVDAFMKDMKGKDWLEKFAQRVVKDDEEDVKSEEPYQQKIADALRLYFGRGSTMKMGPAEGSPAPGLPIMAKIINRIYARVVSMVDASQPVAVPTADDDNERAMRITQHAAWEKRAKYPEWKPGMNASVVQWELIGSMFRYCAWDPLKKKRAECYLSSMDVHMPYTDKDTTPQLENVERVTIEHRMPKHKIRRLGAAGFFTGVKDLFDKNADKKPTPYSSSDANAKPINEAVADLTGQEFSEGGRRDSYVILERHSWEDVPGEDLPRRMAIWEEKSTKRVLRLVCMEKEDKMDRLRFDNETNLAKQAATNVAEGLTVPSAPQPKPVRTEPIYPLVHYVFMPNPEGIKGLGVWVFAAELNELANNLAGEDLVSHRMANVQGGFVSDDVDPEKGDIKLTYGKFKSVSVPSGRLADSFMTLPFERPKGNLGQYIQLLDDSAQAVMSSSDSQSGMPGPSHETARAALARMQAGSTAITAAVESFLIPLAVEYKNYARLNATYMSDVEYFFVTETAADGQSTSVRKQIGRADYDADYDITFDADVRLEADPGLGQSAIQAYQLVRADPIAMQNPNLQLDALKKALRALKAPDLAAKLPQNIPPPQPPTPMSQVDENALFMQDKDHPVLDDDDHAEHLERMTEVEASPLFKQYSPTAKQLHQRHKQAHQAKAYQQAVNLQNQVEQMDIAERSNLDDGARSGLPGMA